jgi:AraC-like DNA-binding protein
MTTTPPVSLTVRWLINPEESVQDAAVLPVEVEVLQRGAYPFPPELGHGSFERLTLAPGISLYRGVHRFRPGTGGRLVPLGEFEADFPATMLWAQSVRGGTILHRELLPPAELIYRPGHDFFRRAERMHSIPSVDSSSDSEMTSLIIAESALAGLMGEDLAQQLIVRLGLERPPVATVLRLPLHLSAPLHAALSPTLSDQVQRLFGQAKVLEYLCALAAHLGAHESERPRTERSQDRVRALHDHLLQLEGKLPTVDQLALSFDMPARRLNDAFTHEYGESIYAFVSNVRLTEAHTALVEGDLPIKVLSRRLGYSHVNHFTRAFTRRFGYPPGSLRRGRGKDGA